MVNGEAVEIDGSQGEGGGEVLRTSFALAALLQKKVSITGVRAGREKPGLKPQHLTALQTLASISGAGLRGASKGSTAVSFFPSKINDTKLAVNIGTAGSISLLLQQLLPVALKAELNLRVIGGTNVEWSPPVEFLQHLLFPLLKGMGARFGLSVSKRGYYPRGKGIANFSSRRARLPLKPVCLTEFREPESVMLFSHCSDLPEEVSTVQAASAKRVIRGKFPGIAFSEHIEFRQPSDTIGSGVTLIAVDSGGNRLSASALGRRGKPAGTVGKEAAERLLREISAGKAVDSHAADQLVPFMALAKGYSTIQCSRLTQHSLANIAVCEQLLGVRFDVKGSLGQASEIFVEGIGLT
jgi:RNA 3'-terminal phosphate cyclase (ATP)